MTDEQNKRDPWKGIIARSGHLKDYFFQPGVITGVGDGTNQGLVKFTVQIGQQSSGDDDENGKWAYPFIMTNHAAFSDPVVGSKIWVLTNLTNPEEIFYILMPELQGVAQSAIDSNDYGRDTISFRQDGLSTSSLTHAPGEGYNIVDKNGYGNFGGGSNEQRDSAGNGYSTKSGKTVVGKAGNVSEPMVLGNQLKDIFSQMINALKTFSEELGISDPPTMDACENLLVKLNDIGQVIGMEDFLSDNSEVASNAKEKLADSVENMNDADVAEQVANTVNQYGGLYDPSTGKYEKTTKEQILGQMKEDSRTRSAYKELLAQNYKNNGTGKLSEDAAAGFQYAAAHISNVHRKTQDGLSLCGDSRNWDKVPTWTDYEQGTNLVGARNPRNVAITALNKGSETHRNNNAIKQRNNILQYNVADAIMNEMNDWQQTHPNATTKERNEYIEKRRRELVNNQEARNYVQYGGDYDPKYYTTSSQHQYDLSQGSIQSQINQANVNMAAEYQKTREQQMQAQWKNVTIEKDKDGNTIRITYNNQQGYDQYSSVLRQG